MRESAIHSYCVSEASQRIAAPEIRCCVLSRSRTIPIQLSDVVLCVSVKAFHLYPSAVWSIVRLPAHALLCDAQIARRRKGHHYCRMPFYRPER